MKADLRDAGVRDLSTTSAARAADRTSVRRTNLGLVLRLLRDAGPRSRTRIAADTGLPKATVTQLIADLMRSGLVRVGENERDGAVGRPSRLVEIDGHTICGIGVEVNVDYLSLISLNLKGDVTAERRIALDVARAKASSVLSRVAELIHDTLDLLDANEARAVGVTLATPGVVDTTAGIVAYASNIGWHDVPAITALQERLGPKAPPIRIENDAKLGAIAEYLLASTTDIHDLIYVTGETGVGGGIISGGRLLRGASGFAGEIGHMPLDPSGQQCSCGRHGCWETMVGLSVLLRLAADPADEVRDTSLDLEHRLAVLWHRAADDDPRTLAALDQIADNLGLGLGLLVDVLNPRAIVLGGYFAYFGDYLVDRVRRGVDERVMAPNAGGSEIMLSTLGFTAAARGGACLALDTIYQDPAAVETT